MKHPHRNVNEKFKLKTKAELLEIPLDRVYSKKELKIKIKEVTGKGVSFLGYLNKQNKLDVYDKYQSLVTREKLRLQEARFA